MDTSTTLVGCKREAAGHQDENVNQPRCSADLLIHIIHQFAEIEVKREEWLRLRLVNKLFNKHILFSHFVLDNKTFKYVWTPLCHKQYYGTEQEWLSPNFAVLHRSWWLQGQLLKPHTRCAAFFQHTLSNGYADDPVWWKRLVDESALLLLGHIDLIDSNLVDSHIFTGFVSSVSSPISVTFQKAKELICDAVACLLTIEELDKINRPQAMFFVANYLTTTSSLSAAEFTWSPCDVMLLTTCFLGHISAIQHSLRRTIQASRSSEDTRKLRFLGLYIATRQHHNRLVSFFLASAAAEVSDQEWLYILCAAAQTGNVPIIHCFLSPKYSERRDMSRFHYTIKRAAEHTNTTVRVKMCKLLLSFCDRLPIWSRTSLLIAACRSNDVAFAEWIIGTGPVEFYGKDVKRDPFAQHPLSIAVDHGSTDVISFLLNSNLEVHEDTDRWVIHKAILHAESLGRSDVFVALIPYQTQLSREDILEHATTVDRALEAVETLWGQPEITPEGVSGAGKAFDSLQMLGGAVQCLLVSNVEWLLKHGFRTETMIEYWLDQPQYGHGYGHKPRTKSFRTVVKELGQIQHLLEVYNNPGIVMKCSESCTSPVGLIETVVSTQVCEYQCTCGKNV